MSASALPLTPRETLLCGNVVMGDELALTGYRSFEHRQSIALAPLTILYGRNNAGKSALLRALLLLSDSVTAVGPDVERLMQLVKARARRLVA